MTLDASNIFCNDTNMKFDWAKALSLKEVTKGWRPFELSRQYVLSLKLNGYREWLMFLKTGGLPSDIPHHPPDVYKNCGWVSWTDWLGTKNFYTKKPLRFEDARIKVRSLGLKSYRQWLQYASAGRLPPLIPRHPVSVYEKEWRGWQDFLGTDIEEDSDGSCDFIITPIGSKAEQMTTAKTFRVLRGRWHFIPPKNAFETPRLKEIAQRQQELMAEMNRLDDEVKALAESEETRQKTA